MQSGLRPIINKHMADTKKLFLLDSYALIFRAYYAFISNPMRNAKGMNTSTVFGFTLALDEILRKENPTHIAAAFDSKGPTFRHEIFPDYKANRDATPEDIREAVPWIKELLAAYQIPVIEKQGFEADDIIGTLAKKAEKKDFEVYMMTPDKDFAQLVSENIFMYKPGRSGNPPEVLGVEEVKEKFQIKDPIQVIDILALWGDSADNIPGAPGVGEKTAKKLIASYGSVEGVYEHIEELKGKQKENLENSKEQVALSKHLATIVLDVPLEIELDNSIRKSINKDELERIFKELNFKNLGQRILSTSNVISPSQTGQQTSLFQTQEELSTMEVAKLDSIDSIDHEYILIEDEESLLDLVEDLKRQDKFCFDTETTGLNPIDAQLVGISFSWESHKAYYVNLMGEKCDISSWISILKPVFEDPKSEKIGQNLKYDSHILKNYDINLKGLLFDTMVAHYLLHPDKKHGLDAIAEDFLAYQKIKTEDLIGKKGRSQLSFANIDPQKVKEYAGEDADITWQIYTRLSKEIQESNLRLLSEKIEMPLVTVLMEMEHAGVSLNSAALSIFAEDLRTDLIGMEKKIFDFAGMDFNINSPKQLGEVLFDRMKIVEGVKKQTKSKQHSTAEDVLINLVDKHEIVQEVLNYRSAKKLLSTYVEALPKLINPKTNRIHASFNQTLVTTGRLSSNNPNLQNIPIREERGREIRRAFIPSDKDHAFLSADYSQIELRLMAHLSEDENMISAFMKGEDIHTATASKVYNIDLKDVTKEMRSKAKTANFGIIYGISSFGLSQRMRIPRKEAKELIDGYFLSYPGVRQFMDECIKLAMEKGYVETMFGRRRLLPDILSRNQVVRGNAERNAINTPIQGTAADIIKIAMVNIHRTLKEQNLKSEMIIQVHDELNFDVLRTELDQVKEIVKTEMESAVKLKVPLIVDMDTGNNWLEAH
jgi:DNA polymerase I